MTAMDLEIVDLTEIVDGFDIACEYAGDEPTTCQDDPAQWALHLNPCCPAGSGIRLACNICKELRMTSGVAVRCEHCNFVFFPASKAYRYIEPLEHK